MENGQLDTDRILAQVDALYEENRGEEAERLMPVSYTHLRAHETF